VAAFAVRLKFEVVLCGWARWVDNRWFVDSLPLTIAGPPCAGNIIVGLLPPEASRDDRAAHTDAYDAILDANPTLDMVCGIVTPLNGDVWCRDRRASRT